MKSARIAVLVTLLVSVPAAAFAQASDAGASSPAPVKEHKINKVLHTKLKHHGKNAARQEAASAAGTNATGTQN